MPEPTGPEDSEEQKRRKQLEITCRVLAGSVVRQLIDSGCDAGQLIDFASEVLRCVTDRGLSDGPGPVAPVPAERAKITTVAYRAEPLGDHHHRVLGSRVMLRPLDVGDGDLLAAWAAEREIRRTLSEGLLRHLLARMSEVVADPSRRDLVVCNEGGRAIGLVTLYDIDEEIGQAEMAKLLGDPAMRGKGYAKEATHLLLAYAFHELALRRVFLRTAGFNLHNIRLNEKVGFKFEGILRRAHLLDGTPIDIALMSMLRAEYLRAFRLEP
ncbi:MAG TPA: GNAT family protein, partial [Phycisphaerae bacterium]|nr:GNAT family protein [Phycisphaerae bacterium]